ncbi:hypothetical protein LINGRAHAP2_LOCUS22346 [Linum grandiflorum]
MFQFLQLLLIVVSALEAEF